MKTTMSKKNLRVRTQVRAGLGEESTRKCKLDCAVNASRAKFKECVPIADWKARAACEAKYDAWKNACAARCRPLDQEI